MVYEDDTLNPFAGEDGEKEEEPTEAEEEAEEELE